MCTDFVERHVPAARATGRARGILFGVDSVMRSAIIDGLLSPDRAVRNARVILCGVHDAFATRTSYANQRKAGAPC